jgi:glutathione S-transferase
MDIELLQFRYSPYNEKARWALDLKRVPHRRRSLLPGPHMGTVRRLTGRTGTPVLVVDGTALDGSARILARLEALFPGPPLYPTAPGERAEAERIEHWFDEDIAPRGRRAVLAALLETPMYFGRVFGAGHGAPARLAYGLTVPLAAPLVRKGNGIAGAASVEDGLAAFGAGLDYVAREAAATGYLVGRSFTLADLAAASALAMCVDPPDSPMTRPRPMATPFANLIARFRDHPGAAWVRTIYQRHRGATGDFTGRSPY